MYGFNISKLLLHFHRLFLFSSFTVYFFCSIFTDEQLIISVREFFGAGTETTATTLRWAVLLLIHHPDWQRKLREDIDTLLGQSHPKMEHKEQLPRVEAFILEVQRHANIAPFAIPRAPKKDFSYNGYNFPKGTCVCFALDSVLMDPDIFPDPSKFKPERFIDKGGKCNGEPKEKLIPFSAGEYYLFFIILIDVDSITFLWMIFVGFFKCRKIKHLYYYYVLY